MTVSATQAAARATPPTLWRLAPDLPLARDARRMLVAVASSGGGRIDGDFEAAEAFLLYEKTSRDTRYIGRQLCPLADEDDAVARRSRLLVDCDMVLCAGISDGGRACLSSLGIACRLAHAGAAVGEAVSSL